MFLGNEERYASGSVVIQLPSDIIDTIWMIIDQDLQGLIPLSNLLHFDLKNTDGKLTVVFSQDGDETKIAIDLDYQYSPRFPAHLVAIDDQESQTILLASEVEDN